jgi:hypothetical protein
MVATRSLTIALVLLAFAGALPVRAAVQLELGVEGAAGYNTNVFGRSEGELDDFVGRVGPDIRLLDEDGSVSWEFRYRPEYQAFVEYSDLDDWDHDVLGDLSWHASPRTHLGLTGRYLDVSSNSLLTDDVLLPDGTVDTDLAFRVDRVQRLVADAVLSHNLTPRDSLLLSLGLFDSDPEAEASSNQRTSSATLAYNHRLSATDSIGAFVRYNRQVVELTQDDTRTDFYNVSLQWRHDISPTLFFDVSAGPAFVDSQNQDLDIVVPNRRLYPLLQGEDGLFRNVRASTCPTLDSGTPYIDPTCELFPFLIPSTITPTTDLMLVGDLFEPSSNEITYFASATIEKRWARASAILRYVRDTDNTSSALATRGSVRDAVTGSFRWEPVPRWRLLLVASWQRTEAAGEGFQFVNAVEGTTVQGVDDVARATGIGGLQIDTKSSIDRYTLSGRLTYEFNPRTEVYLRAFYNKQNSSAVGFSREVDRVVVFIGFSHYFTPIRLPI